MTDHMSRGEMLELMRSEAVIRRDAIQAHTPRRVDLDREVQLLTGFVAATEALQAYAHEMKAARIARAQ